MRSVVPVGVASLVRLGVVGALMAVSAGCSSDFTRLSTSFFSDSADSEVTGALGVVPREPIPEGAAIGAPVGEISRAPLEPAPLHAAPASSAASPQTGADGYSVVRAEAGDTAYSLSRRYGVSARAIMAANNMARAEDVRAGQEVRIPPFGWRPNDAAAAAPRPAPQTADSLRPLPPAPAQSAASPRPAAAAQPGARPAGHVHVVQGGETLNAIARRYGLRAGDIARHNGLDSPDRVRVGQRLEIPAHAPVRTASLTTRASDAAPAPAPRPVAGNNDAPSLQPLPPAGEAASGKTDRRATAGEDAPVRTAALDSGEATVPAALPEPAALSSPRFRWPVRGRIVSEFGKKPNGAQNDGINIAVPEGTSVKASENGVVAYVGNELKGFGNLILIRHADDWVTAYAHNSQVLVKRGDQVTRGQIIAKAGQTGSVNQPQLHFELRKGSRPVNPLQHLADNS